MSIALLQKASICKWIYRNPYSKESGVNLFGVKCWLYSIRKMRGLFYLSKEESKSCQLSYYSHFLGQYNASRTPISCIYS